MDFTKGVNRLTVLGGGLTPPYTVKYREGGKSKELPFTLVSDCCGQWAADIDFTTCANQGFIELYDDTSLFYSLPAQIIFTETIKER